MAAGPTGYDPGRCPIPKQICPPPAASKRCPFQGLTAGCGACQIVSFGHSKREAVVAVLDWIGDRPAKAGELVDRGRKVQDFMYWNGQEMLQTAVSMPVAAVHGLAGGLATQARKQGALDQPWRHKSSTARDLRPWRCFLVSRVGLEPTTH